MDSQRTEGIREARERVGLSQSELARRVGTPQQNLSQIEVHNSALTPLMAERLAPHLDVSAERLRVLHLLAAASLHHRAAAMTLSEAGAFIEELEASVDVIADLPAPDRAVVEMLARGLLSALRETFGDRVSGLQTELGKLAEPARMEFVKSEESAVVNG